MALKLGSTDVSFRLGAGEVAAVYLGSQEVWSAVPVPATLYYNDAEEDGLWTTVGNWWLDAEHTEPAGRLPAEIDSVVVSASITASGQTVVDVTFSGQFIALGGTLTVTGMATFNGGSLNNGTVTGNATFNVGLGQSVSGNAGTITGNATFNDFSYNSGIVTGDATFNDSACNSGTVTGTITGDPPSCF
jgi:hypothetical protein